MLIYTLLEKRDCQQFFLEKIIFFFTKEQLTNFRLYVILFLVHEICTIFKGTLTITRRSVAFENELYGFHLLQSSS